MSPASEIAAEIPAFDMRALVRRAALPGAVLAGIAVVVVVTGGPIHALGR